METTSPVTTKSKRRDTDDSRAERKRIQDRLAQRATRERTKNRIAYLEQRLSSLEAGDKHGQITSLTRVIDDLRTNNNRLRGALVKMRTAIDQAVLNTDDEEAKPCGCDQQTNCSCQQAVFTGTSEATFDDPAVPFRQDSASSKGDSEATAVMDTDTVGLNPDAELADVVQADPLQDIFDFSPNTLLEMFEFGPSGGYTGWQSPSPSPFDHRFPSGDAGIRIAPDLDKWEVSNGAFINCLESVKKQMVTTMTLDMHVPFKAAIWGWDNIGVEAQHPVWAALKQVDQRVFGTWTSKAQRIALMYVCQTLIQYRERPTRDNLERVPMFLRPRPSQENIQHPAVIDFLIWPGLRDRLVFEHRKYTSTGDLSAAFVQNFNFYWPFSEKEIFAFNPTQNRYEVSKMFLDYAYNFKNWTMKPDFFKKFPEMQHDIPAFQGSPELPKPSWST